MTAPIPSRSLPKNVAAHLSRFQWAFAFSGGGAAGAYTAGVVYGFHRLGVLDTDVRNVRAIHGVSTGALVGTLMGLGKFEELAETYRNVTTPDILTPSHNVLYEMTGKNIIAVLAACLAFGPPYLYSTKPLRAVIDGLMGPDHAGFAELLRRKDRLELGYSAVDLNLGRAVALTNRIENMTPELLREALLGSSNQPMLMDLVRLPQVRDNCFVMDGPQHVYCDGGIKEQLPLDPILFAPHAEEIDVIVTVLLDPPVAAPVANPFNNLLDLLVRATGLLGFNVGNSDKWRAYFIESLMRCQRLIEDEIGASAWSRLKADFPAPIQEFLTHGEGYDKPFDFIEFHPDELGIPDALEFVPEQMQRAFDKGYAEAEAKLLQWWATRGQYLTPRVERPRRTSRRAVGVAPALRSQMSPPLRVTQPQGTLDGPDLDNGLPPIGSAGPGSEADENGGAHSWPTQP